MVGQNLWKNTGRGGYVAHHGATVIFHIVVFSMNYNIVRLQVSVSVDFFKRALLKSHLLLEYVWILFHIFTVLSLSLLLQRQYRLLHLPRVHLFLHHVIIKLVEMSRTDMYQRCRKKHDYCSRTELKDPMYKTFDVVSSFSHSSYYMYIIFD